MTMDELLIKLGCGDSKGKGDQDGLTIITNAVPVEDDKGKERVETVCEYKNETVCEVKGEYKDETVVEYKDETVGEYKESKEEPKKIRSPKLYRINKNRILYNGYERYIPNENIIDYHTIVLTEIGNARKKDIQKFLETCIERYAIENKDYLWGSWKINLIVNRFGSPRGIAYVYLKSNEMFNILTGNAKNGFRRVKAVENKYFNCDFSSQLPSYKNISFKQEQYIYVPIDKPLFEKPFLFADGTYKSPHIVPYHVSFIFKINVLICNKCPMWITEEIMKKELQIFEERHITVSINNDNSIYITFPSNTMATFSLVMLKKLKVKHNGNVAYLSFKLLR